MFSIFSKVKKHQFLTKKKSIAAWLESHNINKYELIEGSEFGFIVNALQTVILKDKKLDFIPVKFNTCLGNFIIENNNLTSLKGAPHTVSGYFNCSRNQLTSLVGGPIKTKSYYCRNNKLTSLEGIPEHIEGTLDCGYNKINTALFCPEKINDVFQIEYNPIMPAKTYSYDGTVGDGHDDEEIDRTDFNFFYSLHLIEKERNTLSAFLAPSSQGSLNSKTKI